MTSAKSVLLAIPKWPELFTWMKNIKNTYTASAAYTANAAYTASVAYTASTTYIARVAYTASMLYVLQ